jgi:deoxyribodipyrimidine photolyase-like uncharacterized protein
MAHSLLSPALNLDLLNLVECAQMAAQEKDRGSRAP